MIDTKGSSWSTYSKATAAEIIERFTRDGRLANHLEWIMSQPNPAITARSRARGCWDANLGESCSAYERLADLIDAGEIHQGNAGKGHKVQATCQCGTCITARRTMGRAWAA